MRHAKRQKSVVFVKFAARKGLKLKTDEKNLFVARYGGHDHDGIGSTAGVAQWEVVAGGKGWPVGRQLPASASVTDEGR
jgi:hypothetical protein